MTAQQHKMLVQASLHAIREPARGAYRRRSGEVDHVTCFSSRSIQVAVARGWLVERPQGGYIATVAGVAALRAQQATAWNRRSSAAAVRARSNRAMTAADGSAEGVRP